VGDSRDSPPDWPSGRPGGGPGSRRTRPDGYFVALVTTPPVAARIAAERELFGERVIDEYGWLRERDRPDTEAHLGAENTYAESVLSPLAPLRRRIYDEIVARTLQTDVSP